MVVLTEGATSAASASISRFACGANGFIIHFVHGAVEFFEYFVEIDVTEEEFLADGRSVKGPLTYFTPSVVVISGLNGIKPFDHGVMQGIASVFAPKPMTRASADHDGIKEMIKDERLIHEGIASAEKIKLTTGVAEGVLHWGR